MGIECLSRGGQNAVFVDNNKESIDVIKQNINGAKVSDRAEVMSCDVTSAISKLAQKVKLLMLFLWTHLMTKVL